MTIQRNDEPAFPGCCGCGARTPSVCAHSIVFIAGLFICFSAEQCGLAAEKTAADYANMTIEQLLNEPVTSVAKKEQRVFEAPAAIYVITDEEIRRSGLDNIPEILRLAPGLDVAQITANQWGISSRGFNGLYANKLLVLIDGRSVYSPIFSGVNWDSQDTLIEDIERIEVIRGPGATLWGANAVNGIINVITKNAKDTQGTLVTGGAASDMPGFGAVRYGGKINENSFYRVYAKYFDRDEFLTAAGRGAGDPWDIFRTGFRTDWEPDSQNTLTFQGDVYSGRVRYPYVNNQFNLAQTTIVESDILGANVLGRWTHHFSASELDVQMYYDRAEREERRSGQLVDTFDIDANHRFTLGERNEIVWGLGYRLIDDHDLSFAIGDFDPRSATRHIFSTFVQDEIKLVDKRLTLTLGSKLEHNDYTGWEVQPGARLLFTPHEQHTVWASAARAVRTPARFEQDVNAVIGVSSSPPLQLNLRGNPRFESEVLTAYELGYRVQPTRRLSFDVTGFYNVYDDLRTGESGDPVAAVGPPARLDIPLTLDNRSSAHTYGAELASTWRVTDSWRLTGSYSWLRLHRELHHSTDPTLPEGESPQHQAQLRSSLDLPAHMQFDAAAYYVDTLGTYNLASYVRIDLRLGWQPLPNLDFSVGVRNLLDDRHAEFGRSAGVGTSEVPRTYYGKFTWRF